MLGFIAWLILLAICWPLAIIAAVLWIGASLFGMTVNLAAGGVRFVWKRWV